MGKKIGIFMLSLLLPGIIFAAANSVDSVRIALNNFATNWNHGNIEGVIEQYKNSDTTTLIWSQLIRGHHRIETYLQKNYSAKNMGTLSTSNIKIQLISPRYALVTGDWLIKENNKDTGGPFSMLYENTSQGWKIVLDHGTIL